jgi:hypothetical protein
MLGERHGLVAADERALHHVVALAMCVKARFRRQAARGHVGVMRGGDLLGRDARPDQRKRMLLGLFDGGETVEKLLARLAEAERPRNLGIHAAGAVDLDQQRQVIAGFQPSVLEMPAHEGRAHADPRGRAKEDALLAAKPLGHLLAVGGDVDIADAQPDEGADLGEHLVLKAGGGLDQLLFLGAFHRLDRVECVGNIDEGRAAQPVHKPLVKTREEPGRRRQPDALGTVMAQLGDGNIGIVCASILDRREGRRGQQRADAAVNVIARVEGAAAAERPHLDHRHGIEGIEQHRARIAIVRGNVGQPFHIAAEPVIAGLRDDGVELLLGHHGAHRVPPPPQLRRGNAGGNAGMAAHGRSPRTRLRRSDIRPSLKARTLWISSGRICSA